VLSTGDYTLAINGQATSTIAAATGNIQTETEGNYILSASGNITIDGTDYALTTRGTYDRLITGVASSTYLADMTQTNLGNYTVDSTGQISFDSDVAVTIDGQTISVTTDGGELDLTSSANIDINAGTDITIDGQKFTLTPLGDYQRVVNNLATTTIASATGSYLTTIGGTGTYGITTVDGTITLSAGGDILNFTGGTGVSITATDNDIDLIVDANKIVNILTGNLQVGDGIQIKLHWMEKMHI